ncbi:MAG: hypothetical protein GX763_03375 [Clostridiaceae bacterium]|nr:hypothetical protein [Clostridiaceae bacterium]
MTNKEKPTKKKPSEKLSEDEKDKRIRQLEYELKLQKIKTEYLELLRDLGQEKTKEK